MAPSYARLRPATSLLIACLLGSVCIDANAKRSTRHRKTQDLPKDVDTSDSIYHPTNFNVHVFCNNTLKGTWQYDPESEYDIDGFFIALCHKDGSNCFNVTVLPALRGVMYDNPQYNTTYQASIFAFTDSGSFRQYSKPDQAAFSSYPKIPDLKDLTVTAISPTALKAQWNSKWNDKIEFSVCSDQTCTKETVAGDDLEHTFTGLEPSTTYIVSAQAEATVNHQTCKGHVQKKSATTHSIEPPTNLNADVLCSNQIELTWEYDVMKESNIQGFSISICKKDGSPCINKTTVPGSRNFTYQISANDTDYHVNISAFKDEGSSTVYSQPAQANFRSYPEIPDLKDLIITVASPRALKAQWGTGWNDNIQFSVCSADQLCQNKTVGGEKLEYTFTGLKPRTVYTVSAQAEATLKKRTCKGPIWKESATTLPLQVPTNVTVTLSCDGNVDATWQYQAQDDIDGFISELCYKNGASCQNRTLAPSSRDVSYVGIEPNTAFIISVRAYVDDGYTSDKVEESFTSLPKCPPTNLTVDVLCTNKANVTWKYDDKKSATGFVARLCYGDYLQNCTNETISNNMTYYSFSLPESNALYKMTVWAYHEKTFSKPAEANFMSYPQFPEFSDVNVIAMSTTRLFAEWQDQWANNVYFTICSSPTECRNETVKGTQHGHMIYSLHPNTTYTVIIKTGATLGNRTCFGPEQKRRASTFVTTPGKVEHLKGKIVNGTLLEASWDAPKGEVNVTGYTVQCNDAATHYNQSEDIAGGNETNHVSFTLHEMTATFNCSVRAFNNNATGQEVYGPADSFDVTTNGIEAPKDVTLLAQTATSLTYKWSADPNATECEVEVHREDAYEKSFGRIEACGKSVNGTVTHNVTDLDPYTRYNVSIKNCRDTFCGEPFFAVSITNVAAPSEVRNFSYDIKKYVSVNFTWQAPEHPNGPLGGYILRIFDEDAQEMKLLNLRPTDTDITVDLEDQFHLFNVSIEAFNYDNTTNATLYSSQSELKFETFGKGPMPPRPKAEDVKENSVLLAWEEPEDPRFNITGFEVKVAGQTPFSTKAHNVTIEHLNPWTKYDVNVSSCTNKTHCGQDRHFDFRTDFGEPSAPQDFKAPSAGTRWMLVQWEKPKVFNGPLSGYNLTVSHGGSQTQAVTTQLSYNATDLVPGTDYEVTVFAFNEVESVVKKGPAVTLKASTQADTPSHTGASTATIVLAVLIPLTFFIAVIAFFLYKKYQKRTGENTPLTSAVDS